MPLSELIHYLHWLIYIGSLISLLSLFTRYSKIGAFYLGILFLTQFIFHGCLIVDLQNYFRIQEGLPPIANGFLTERLSNDTATQSNITFAISLLSFYLSFI